jgi:hypothetical protein
MFFTRDTFVEQNCTKRHSLPYKKKLIRIAKRILILNDQILGLINPKGTEKVEKRKKQRDPLTVEKSLK